MEAMPEEWTEGRLNELSGKVDSGFERVDAELRALRVEMVSIQRTMLQGFIAMTGGILAGFAVLGGIIATQL
ncbi:MAG TPA: hypothetical protein VNO20_03900 [Solirubrobacterales bacterium]|nr:hypothetical protein [Solirubrobacterales bacterium]